MGERRQEIREEVGEITSHTTTGLPHNAQMKKLEALSIESMLLLDETIDKMRATNNKLDASNKKLTQSNLKLQRVAISIAVAALLTTLALGIFS